MLFSIESTIACDVMAMWRCFPELGGRADSPAARAWGLHVRLRRPSGCREPPGALTDQKAAGAT